jgi:hypothetical protein
MGGGGVVIVKFDGICSLNHYIYVGPRRREVNIKE